VVLGVVRIQLRIELSAKKQSKVRAIPHFQSVMLPSVFVRQCLKIGSFLFFLFFFWENFNWKLKKVLATIYYQNCLANV